MVGRNWAEVVWLTTAQPAKVKQKALKPTRSVLESFMAVPRNVASKKYQWVEGGLQLNQFIIPRKPGVVKKTRVSTPSSFIGSFGVGFSLKNRKNRIFLTSISVPILMFGFFVKDGQSFSFVVPHFYW